jgi:predicted aspartyl protease
MTLKRKLKTIPQGEINMGLTHVVVRLFNSPSQKTYDADFLVDTGAMDTMAPASELKKLGIQATGKEVYELANGELVEWEHGSAEIEFMGVVVPIRIIFGPDNSKPLLGVIALETAGFIVDPKHQTLRKLRARPLKRVA